jgi:Cyclin, N-terminal domain/Cyclin, C-terminal domain
LFSAKSFCHNPSSVTFPHQVAIQSTSHNTMLWLLTQFFFSAKPFCHNPSSVTFPHQVAIQSTSHNTNKNPFYNMSMADIASTLEVMRLQEASYRCHDYLSCRPMSHPTSLKRPQAGIASSPVDVECRFKMAEWCYQVVDFCKFSRETVAIAMSYLDRYISTETGLPALYDRKVFQLAAMTCLYTAIKIHEPEAMEPRIIAQLSRGVYTEEQVTDMELEILMAIQWRMNPPTALSFINNFFALLPEGTMNQSDRDTVYELAKFQTELAVHEYSLVAIDASTLAFSALMNSLETVACAKSMDIMAMIAKVASIDIQSTLVSELQDKLYEVVNGGISSTGPSMRHHLTPKSPVPKCFISRRGSVHVSPRSVMS